MDLPQEDRFLEPRLEDVYAVGALDGAEWETFSRISSLAFDGEGNLYVLDGGNQRVVKVGPTGELLAEMGGAGEGPGEFGAPRSLTVLPDGSVAVFDLSKRGFALFQSDGTFLRTVPLVEGFETMPGREVLALPSGDAIAVGATVMTVDRGGPRVGGDSSGRPVYRYSLEDGSADLLFRGWKPSAPEVNSTLSAGGGMRAVIHAGSGKRAFDAELHIGVLPDGTVAVVDSVTYEVKMVGREGDLARVLCRPIPPRRVTGDDKERERARRLEAMESGDRPAVAVSGGGTTRLIRGGQASELMKGSIEDLEFAEEIPVVQDLTVDWEGRIWVERFGGVGERGPIDILTGGGTYLGSLRPDDIRMPAAFGPDGWVAFMEKDELDVPRVEVKRVTLG